MTDQLIFPERGRGADKLKINFMTEGQLVVVRTFGSGPEADMAKDALEAAGIDAMIQADTPVACGPTLPGAGSGFKLLIREEDAGAARDLLKSPLTES